MRTVSHPPPTPQANTSTPPAGFEPARVRFSAPVQPRIEYGYARVGEGGWLQFIPVAGLPPGVLHRSYPPHQVRDMDTLVSLPAPASLAVAVPREEAA